MQTSTIVWTVWALGSLALELLGVFHVGPLEPLTDVVRREMFRSSIFTGAVAAFLLWLLFHFLYQTYLPHFGGSPPSQP